MYDAAGIYAAEGVCATREHKLFRQVPAARAPAAAHLFRRDLHEQSTSVFGLGFGSDEAGLAGDAGVIGEVGVRLLK